MKICNIMHFVPLFGLIIVKFLVNRLKSEEKISHLFKLNKILCTKKIKKRSLKK